jgi:glycosyltransferase involved in cell wall biosynthesis
VAVRPLIKVAFASGTDDLNAQLIERMRQLYPGLPLYVVSEFPPAGEGVKWVRYRVGRGFENLARCRAAFRGKSIRLAAVLLVPDVPFRWMRLMALWLAPVNFIAFNENLNDFMLRPRCIPAIVRHAIWRAANFFRWHFGLQSRTSLREALTAAIRAAASASAHVRVRFRGSGRRRVKDAIPPDPDPNLCAALWRAFEEVPDLFCASAAAGLEIRTRGEEWTYQLCGNRRFSLYDPAKFRELGGFDRAYRNGSAADLDLCYRAWQRGWPTVHVAVNDAVAPLAPAGTTRDYLRFLARRVWAGKVFRRLWRQAVGKTNSRRLLSAAPALVLAGGPRKAPAFPDEEIWALTDGSVSVFRGSEQAGKPRVLIASPYLPFPLSHGGAVRMYNLMRRAAEEFDLILLAFTERPETPARELLGICMEAWLVQRAGSHALPSTGRPDVVEEFSSDAFRGALRLALRRWRPDIVQLEFTQMAQYAADCAPARTILVEHDITFDLYSQLLSLSEDWDLRRQTELWRDFETAAWRNMTCVVAMSEKDRAMIRAPRVAALPNGVDLERFRPSAREPEPRRLLFIGSFAHLPNLLAAAFFLGEVWPALHNVTLHIIAGARHEYFLTRYEDRIRVELDRPNVEVEGFVSDVRPAYERAAVVVAPLVASAGTNIKILEAMAAGKAIVSTPAGVNGFDLWPGEDFLLARSAEEMAESIERLLASPEERRRLGMNARARVERDYSWDEIARRQAALYRELLGT